MSSQKSAFFVFLGIICMAGFAWAGDWDVQAGAEFYFPSDSFWDSAYGGEAKLIYWEDWNVGLALAAGFTQWDVDGDLDPVVTVPGSYERFQSWQGDSQYIPLGVSLMSRHDIRTRSSRQAKLMLEGGIRYMLANGSMDLVETERVWVNPGQYSETNTRYHVDDESGWVGRVGASLAWDLTEPLSVFLTGGYQFDLSKGQVSVPSLMKHQEIDLAAFYLQLGLALELK